MKLKLIDQAGVVLRKAWSVRLVAISALFDGGQLVLSLVTPNKPPTWFVGLSFAITVAAVLARFVAQPRMQAEVYDANTKPAK